MMVPPPFLLVRMHHAFSPLLPGVASPQTVSVECLRRAARIHARSLASQAFIPSRTRALGL